ncbi:MAG TPA: RluA family pseudouridine synthase [Xanthobacteraceae bacterium]|nr:RluA family pseudouridine synthase [Xanthobacteraceae bacterium]
MPKKEKIETAVASAEEKGARLDRFLAAKLPALSRTRLKALILAGEVQSSGRTIKDPEYRVKPGEFFTVRVPPPRAAKPAAEQIPLDVVYEDKDVIVIDKPAGLVVHPAPGNAAGTLVNALIAHCGKSLSGIGGEKRPGIVHRLDKDTSGLLVAAKNDRAHRSLAAQFADHGRSGGLRRAYLALVWGVPSPLTGTIDLPIGRDPRSRVKMSVRANGRRAVTHYNARKIFKSREGKPVASLVECELETGRTHQIRVHLAKIGHPLLGDETYGKGFRSRASRLSPPARRALDALGRQALHAYLLGFTHPTKDKALCFESKPPKTLANLIAALTKQ